MPLAFGLIGLTLGVALGVGVVHFDDRLWDVGVTSLVAGLCCALGTALGAALEARTGDPDLRDAIRRPAATYGVIAGGVAGVVAVVIMVGDVGREATAHVSELGPFGVLISLIVGIATLLASLLFMPLFMVVFGVIGGAAASVFDRAPSHDDDVGEDD